jgi:hypothetical protein
MKKTYFPLKDRVINLRVREKVNNNQACSKWLNDNQMIVMYLKIALVEVNKIFSMI